MITPETLTDEIAPFATSGHAVLPPMHRNPSAVVASPCTCDACAHTRATLRSIDRDVSFHVEDVGPRLSASALPPGGLATMMRNRMKGG